MQSQYPPLPHSYPPERISTTARSTRDGGKFPFHVDDRRGGTGCVGRQVGGEHGFGAVVCVDGYAFVDGDEVC